MSTYSYDVIVIGAGLGGACAALALAKRNARVLLLESDTFPRHKVCGEFLSPEIFETFARVGVEQAVLKAKPVEVKRARVYAPQQRAISKSRTSSTRSLEIDLPRVGWGLSRYELDAILWRENKRAGVDARCDTRVKSVQREGDGFTVSTARETFHARFVVGAAGRNARLFDKNPHNAVPSAASSSKANENIEYSLSPKPAPRYVGFKAHFSGVKNYDGAVELHAYNGGYCGVGAIENGLVNVCALAKYETVAGRSPDDFWRWQLEQSASLRQRMRGATPMFSWITTANISFGRRTPVQNGILMCGDGAGYIHPLTGNGMAMAARSGELAAAIVAASLRGEVSRDEVEELYTRAWHREFGRRLAWASRIEWVLISPRLVEPTLQILCAIPHLSQRAFVATRG